MIELPRNRQSRLYERIALAVALAAVAVVGVAAVADDAEAQVQAAAPVAVEPAAPAPEPTTEPSGPATATPEPTKQSPEPAQPDQPGAKGAAKQPGAKSAAKGGTGTRASSGRLRLALSKASPNDLILDSRRPARFKFALADSGRHDVVVRAINTKTSETVMHWRFDDLGPKQKQSVAWDGKIGAKLRARGSRLRARGSGPYAKDGKYTFKVYEAGEPGAEPADSRKAKGKSRLSLHTHQFPIAARHSYGDGFGAGRHHQGQDIFASCGKKLRAARGGRVQTSSYQSSAGNYVVIDGKGTKWDYAYMHLLKRGQVKEGKRVKTGDVIGYVGETGNAVGCHLHFEMWSPPGWYEGGSARPPTKALKKWDSYS